MSDKETQLAKPAEGLNLGFVNLTPAALNELDTDKLKEMLEMKRSEEDRQAEREFNRALAEFQCEMPTVKKGREGRNYFYAGFDDVWRLAGPLLKKHGFGVSFSQSETENDITITCKAVHVLGHSMKTPFTLPKDGPIMSNQGKAVTSKAQAQGSANSYAKRYCFCNAFNIVVSDEDDDGQAAGTQTVDESQADTLRELIDQVSESSRKRFWEWVGVTNADAIPAGKFKQACDALAKTIKKEGKKS